MATKKQTEAAKENIKKAQQTWQNMSPRERAQKQPEGAGRKKPGSMGEGDYYHVEVRPKEEFETFRSHDIGEKGGIIRVAGKRSSGSWSTQKWLISKENAYVDESGYLKGKDADTKNVLRLLGSVPRRKKADVFSAEPRKNVPERKKPTRAQQKARMRNIQKAQEARHH